VSVFSIVSKAEIIVSTRDELTGFRDVQHKRKEILEICLVNNAFFLSFSFSLVF